MCQKARSPSTGKRYLATAELKSPITSSRYITLTVRGSYDSIVFSIGAKFFLFVFFFVNTLIYEPVQLA